MTTPRNISEEVDRLIVFDDTAVELAVDEVIEAVTDSAAYDPDEASPEQSMQFLVAVRERVDGLIARLIEDGVAPQ